MELPHTWNNLFLLFKAKPFGMRMSTKNKQKQKQKQKKTKTKKKKEKEGKKKKELSIQSIPNVILNLIQRYLSYTWPQLPKTITWKEHPI